MFAQPGILGAGIGRLGLGAGALTLVAQALAILAKYGSAANLYLPGIGAINGITAGNWLNSNGGAVATVDGAVGLVVSAGKTVGVELVQAGAWVSFSGAVLTDQSVNGVTVSSMAGDAFSAAYKSVSGLTVGRTYSVRASVNATTTGTAFFRVNEDVGTAVGAELDITCPANTLTVIDHVFVASSTTEQIGVVLSAQLMSVVISSVSIRELPGAHLTQSTAANRPVLRRGLVNQLLWSSDFSNAAWIKSNSGTGILPIITTNSATTPTGQPASRVVLNKGSGTTTTDQSRLHQSISVTSGMTYTHAFWIRTTDGSTKVVSIRDDVSGIVNELVTVTPEWQLFTRSGAAASAASNISLWLRGAIGTSDSASVHAASAIFQGTVTTQQIIDAGGIPVTTTAPASSTSGPFAWQFDGSNDRFDISTGTINEGWVCAGAKLNSNSIGSHIYGNGASANSDVGVWIRVPNTSNMLTLLVGDGTNLEILSAIVGASFVGIPRVFDAGWSASLMTCALNGSEVSQSKTVNCTTPKLTQFGGAGTFGWLSSGDFYPAIIMSVLPTPDERRILRRFIASLSGVTL